MSAAGKLHIVLPAFNVAGVIGPLLGELTRFFPHVPIWLVDDGSRDNLKAAIDAEFAGLHYVRHRANRGKGAALRTGFGQALAAGAEIVLTLDADGQHRPPDAARLVRCAEGCSAGVVIGSRMRKTAGMPLLRVISNRTTSKLVSWKTGQSIPDSQCGLRLYRRWVLEKIALRRRHFDLETEILLQAAAIGADIVSVDINTIYPAGNTSSMAVVDVFRFIRTLLTTRAPR